MKAFKVIFDFNNQTQEELSEKNMDNLASYYYQNVLYFINYIYPGSSKIEKFSEDIMANNLSNHYIIEILQKYIDLKELFSFLRNLQENWFFLQLHQK